MKHENFAPPEYKEGLEADAVCQQCGSVNPEGTLICKTCGNNLRDQRMLRMQADQILDTDNEGTDRSVFLIRAFSILGILLILWLGLNVGRITEMLTSADNTYEDASTITANPGIFWTGSAKSTYDIMYADISGKLPNASEAENARINVTPSSRLAAGDYVLFERRGTEMRYAGVARIDISGNAWHYNASLLDGIEIRGAASLLDGMLASQWDQAGALYQGRYYAVSGTAEAQPDGSINLTGESSHNTQLFSAIAYPYSSR